MKINIRYARNEDVSELTEIYNYYIINTPITFDLDEFSVEQRKEWLSQYKTTGRYKLVVAIYNEIIVGYACSNPLKPKGAYATSVESSVYIRSEYKGMKIGSQLYSFLFDVLAQENIHRIYAGITLPNEGSIALHQKFGFTSVGIYDEVGYKFGKYWNVHWFEKKIE